MGCTENINLTRSKNRFTRPFHRQVRVLQAKNHLNACLHSLYKPFIPFAFFYKFVPLYSLFPPQKTLFIVLSVKQSSSQEKSLSINLTAITSCILSMASFKLPLVLFLSSLFLQAALGNYMHYIMHTLYILHYAHTR